MKRTAAFFFIAGVAAAALAGAELISPSGQRTTPPTVSSVSPQGIARGTTTELTVEGLNLAKASAIFFSEPGISGRIVRVKELPDLTEMRLGGNGTASTVDLGPMPPHNQITVEVEVSPDAEVGPVRFRVQTPLGTSPAGRLLIEPYYGETPDREPNNTPEEAFETVLPTILTGTISRPGDVDYFKIKVNAGEQLVFENAGGMIGSTLSPLVSILAEDQSVVKEFGAKGGREEAWFAHKFDKAGTYYIRVADFENSGKASNLYRIKVGNFPLAVRAYPLGLEQGKTRDITFYGWNLGAGKEPVKGELTAESEDRIRVRPHHSYNEMMLAVGREPEVDAAGGNRTPAQAQTIAVPVTVNGRIEAPRQGAPAQDYFRFHARKDQKIVVEVNARRLGSDLDSLLEVLDVNGKPIERATVRAVSGTFTTLRDRDSFSAGLRIQSWSDWKPGDYIMMGNEIMQVEALPNGPDDDVKFESFGGERMAFFDTSTEAQALDRPVYKVQLFPPGTKFSPNGLPLVHLFYQNDDGGPGYGKDSLLHFTAPADGDYLVRIADIRGKGGENFAYRLTVREPRPDFRLSVRQKNPNVPAGGTVPLTVTAFRMDGFDAPIEVSLEGLPEGLKASKGVIAPGQVSTTLLLSAAPDAHLDRAAPLKIAGRAPGLMRWADPEDKLKLIALMPPADVVMTAETKVVEIEPGGKADITVAIRRQNDFHGRVPVSVMNLPPRVKIMDFGLNGVLITEDESRRAFTVEALPSAQPIEQWIYVAGNVETRSPLPASYAAAQPILLRIKARPEIAAASK